MIEGVCTKGRYEKGKKRDDDHFFHYFIEKHKKYSAFLDDLKIVFSDQTDDTKSHLPDLINQKLDFNKILLINTKLLFFLILKKLVKILIN